MFTLPDLSGVAAALFAVPEIKPVQLTPILDGMRRQIQGMLDEFERWSPTPDEARAAVRATLQSVVQYLEDSPLGELRRLLIEFQQRVLQRAMESLPFRDIATQAEAALRKVVDVLDLVNPDTVRQPIHEFFADLRNQIDGVSADAVKAAIQQVWQAVTDVVNQLVEQIDKARDALQGLVGQVAGLAEQRETDARPDQGADRRHQDPTGRVRPVRADRCRSGRTERAAG